MVLIKTSNLISVLCVLFIISLSLHLSKIKWRCLHSTILRFYKLCFQAHLVSASLVSMTGYYYFNVLELSIPGHRAHVSVLDIEHNRIERWGGVKLRSRWPWTVSSPLTESSVLFLTDNVPRFFIIQRLAIDQWPWSDSREPGTWHRVCLLIVPVAHYSVKGPPSDSSPRGDMKRLNCKAQVSVPFI